MRFPLSVSIAVTFFLSALAVQAELIESDIVIFGGTSSGVTAAVQAHRMGKKAVIVEWTNHLGGLTTGGAGAPDITNKNAIGGISREFYEQIAAYYDKAAAWKWQKPQILDPKQEKVKDSIALQNGRPTKWVFEPHVAGDIYKKWLADAGVTVYLKEKLKSVKMEGSHIVEFTTENDHTFRGKMFIDASYEGDLMAKAGVSYHVGREANSEFDESLNGFRETTPLNQFEVDVDPYFTPGDPSSGLLPFIRKSTEQNPGDGDKHVQAYGLRLCMTRTKDNMLPLSELKPSVYSEKEFELFARYLEAQEKAGKPATGIFVDSTPIPNDKTDSENLGPFSTDLVGENNAYADGDYNTREGIIHNHLAYTKGLLYFLATSPRVPKHIHDEANKWGLAKDEFPDNGRLPTQLYIREGRRMMSDYVMSENNCRWRVQPMDTVGLGTSKIESHNCQRIVQDGFVRTEGDVEVDCAAPFPISYRSIVPKVGQADNLLVPVCLSATHIAYSGIRSEPNFMVLGQSAATAASMAIDQKVPVQKVPYTALKAQFEKDHQIVDWRGPVKKDVPEMAKLEGMVLDDADAQKLGEWGPGGLTNVPHIGPGYIHDLNGPKSGTVVFTPDIPVADFYEVIFYFVPNDGRATHVPVTVSVKGGETRTLPINERDRCGHQTLGVFEMPLGRATTITVSAAGSDGAVVIDGVQIIRLRNN